MSFLSPTPHTQVTRILRILRVLRVLRMLKLLRLLRMRSFLTILEEVRAVIKTCTLFVQGPRRTILHPCIDELLPCTSLC
jgi:hypothetical protein